MDVMRVIVHIEKIGFRGFDHAVSREVIEDINTGLRTVLSEQQLLNNSVDRMAKRRIDRTWQIKIPEAKKNEIGALIAQQISWRLNL